MRSAPRHEKAYNARHEQARAGRFGHRTHQFKRSEAGNGIGVSASAVGAVFQIGRRTGGEACHRIRCDKTFDAPVYMIESDVLIEAQHQPIAVFAASEIPDDVAECWAKTASDAVTDNGVSNVPTKMPGDPALLVKMLAVSVCGAVS